VRGLLRAAVCIHLRLLYVQHRERTKLEMQVGAAEVRPLELLQLPDGASTLLLQLPDGASTCLLQLPDGASTCYCSCLMVLLLAHEVQSI